MGVSMSAYRAVLLVLCLVGAGLVAAVPAGATTDAVGEADATASRPAVEPAAQSAAAANDSANNSSLGADISSFMQASAAEADGTVDTGMWTAEFDATENESARAELVERRTDELRDRLNELQQRKEELTAEREAGNVSETAYKAKISNLVGRIESLRSAINATEPRAERVGADAEELDTLRSQTENLTGPEIAAVARNVSGVDAANVSAGPGGVGNGDGPPADAGNTEVANGTETAGEAAREAASENGRSAGDGVGAADDAANQSANPNASRVENPVENQAQNPSDRTENPRGNDARVDLGESPVDGERNASDNRTGAAAARNATSDDSPASDESPVETPTTALSTVTTAFFGSAPDAPDSLVRALA